jgi:DNA-binding GntR family transcriptional regulator
MPLLEPLPEEKNLSQKVFERVREAILSGELPPGSRLVERRLAEELEVSHIPVREALARLADDGLVERNARRGSWVASLSLEDLDEISSLRVLLEQFVVVRVQERWSDAAERRLRAIVADMQKAAAT